MHVSFIIWKLIGQAIPFPLEDLLNKNKKNNPPES
jgi:hypothetical protein